MDHNGSYIHSRPPESNPSPQNASKRNKRVGIHHINLLYTMNKLSVLSIHHDVWRCGSCCARPNLYRCPSIPREPDRSRRDHLWTGVCGGILRSNEDIPQRSLGSVHPPCVYEGEIDNMLLLCRATADSAKSTTRDVSKVEDGLVKRWMDLEGTLIQIRYPKEYIPALETTETPPSSTFPSTSSSQKWRVCSRAKIHQRTEAQEKEKANERGSKVERKTVSLLHELSFINSS